MSLKNPKLFGVTVNNVFADILDKDAALTTLNLPPRDLDVIKTSSDVVSQTDFVTCSGLTVPVYKTLDRLYQDSLQYGQVLDVSAGFDKILFGNLTVNGRVSGLSIRYKFVNGTGPSAAIKIADISTSRNSSWSSTDSPTLPTSEIFYGSRVGILTTGSLEFSGSVSGNRLKTSIVPEEKEFLAEVATDKISCEIGGVPVTLFAMKGIPLIFKGFFRDLNATISRINIGNIRPTWRIQEVNNLSKKTNYVNRNSTSISYRGVIGKERFLKYYYNPNNVTKIQISNGGITDIPKSTLSSLTDLNLSKNKLEIFPNLKNISPNLLNLNLQDNLFFVSEISTERNLNQNIIDKLPNTLQSLTMGRTFGGSIAQDLLSGNNFPNLLSLNLSDVSPQINNAPRFSADINQNPCQLPNVSNSVINYNVFGNAFEVFGLTNSGIDSYNFQDLTNLETVSVYGNTGLSTSNFSINSPKIKTVRIGGTRLPIPDMRNKLQLTNFEMGQHNAGVGAGTSIYNPDGEFKFNNCPLLNTLSLISSNANGKLPIFVNPELKYLDFRYTRIEGQSGTECMAANTLSGSNKIEYFLIDSRYWGVTTPINSDIFSNASFLYYWFFRTYKKTTGPLPFFAGCPRLRFIVAPTNAFTGNLPNFATTPLIFYIQLSDNNLSGAIPSLTNLTNLYYLFLHNNNFTSLGTFSNLSRLRFFYAHNNNLTGSLSNFSSCLKLERLYLYNNQLSDYQNGYLSSNTSLRFLYLQNNNFSQNAINKIIEDLYDNYNSRVRSGVVVNLSNNAAPGGEEVLEKLGFLKNVARWSIVTD